MPPILSGPKYVTGHDSLKGKKALITAAAGPDIGFGTIIKLIDMPDADLAESAPRELLQE